VDLSPQKLDGERFATSARSIAIAARIVRGFRSEAARVVR
jgi:hypothetical protein